MTKVHEGQLFDVLALQLPGISQYPVFDYMYPGVPEEVRAEIHEIAESYDLKQSTYFLWDYQDEWYTDIDEAIPFFQAFPNFYAYLQQVGIQTCFIHYWW